MALMLFACERCNKPQWRQALAILPICDVMYAPPTAAKKSVKLHRCGGTMLPASWDFLVTWAKLASASNERCAQALDESRAQVAQLERENAAP